MIEKEIIKDQKETIHRLQDECMEKTKIILKLNQENERLKQSEQEGLEINAELEHYLACMTEQRNKLKLALEEIRGILCKGRTFYDGYFENENLSRTDKAIKVISEVLK